MEASEQLVTELAWGLVSKANANGSCKKAGVHL
jgi:hypothetical protein